MAVNSLETIISDASIEATQSKISKSPSKSEAPILKPSRIPRSTNRTRVRSITADGVTSRGAEPEVERPSSANVVESRTPRSRKEITMKQSEKFTDTKLQSTGKSKPQSPEKRKKATSDLQSDNTGITPSNENTESWKPQRAEQRKRSRIPSLKNTDIKKNTGNESLEDGNKSTVNMKTTVAPVEKVTERRKKDNRTSGNERLEKLKVAMSRDFSSLVPLYETELKKIIDTWVNTIYCSLSMRRNLVKLLFDEFPDVDKSHFRMEDETLLRSFLNAKNITKSEIRNFQEVINSLIKSQSKMKEEYEAKASEYKEVAQAYNYNWEALQQKMKDLEIETRELQEQIPKLEEMRQEIEKIANEKIQKLEKNLSSKAEEINNLSIQVNMFKQRENTFKGNVLMKVEEYKDIKAEVDSLKTVEKEFEEMKNNYLVQKESYQKRIKDLEFLLEERKKTLERESLIKKQLEDFLTDLQAQQKQLYRNAGKEQVEFVLGRNVKSRREQLWMSSVRLVLKAFQAQIKKLEKDRNKMLLQLNSNDLDNFTGLATALLQKESFLNSIKYQMQAFHKMSKCSRVHAPEDFQQSQIMVNDKET